MSECFGPAAQKLSGLAARLLGWRPGEFWSATPAELAAALAPTATEAPLGRGDFNLLMERENG